MTMEEYYILLVEKVAIKKERGLTPRPLQQKANQSETQVLEGSLWRVPVDDREKQRQSADLHSVEFEGVVLYNFPLNSPDIQKLTPDQFNLLLAVPTCKDRNEVFLNKQWLAEAVHLQIGSIVYLVNLPGFTEPRIPGKVRYKGSLPHEQGTWFGVELSKEHQGKGTSDGNYRCKRFFTCHMDSAVFKSINKLAYCANPQEFTEGDDLSVNAELNYPGILPPPPPLSLGERVVWINDAKVEPAVVKWIGILPDTREPIEWMIGVEFEHQVGTGTGKYKDQQLFKARQGHASLVPAMGLMLESEYYGHFGVPHSPQHESFNTMSSTRSTIPRNFTASAHSSTSSRHNTMPTPSPSRQSTLPLREHELQTISRQETHSPDGKYEPTISSNTLPLSKQVISPEKFVPQRNHAQYFGHHASLPKNSSLVTNRSQSTQSLERAVEPSSNELDHLSGHMEGRFSTIHHSQPSQIVRLPPESSPTSATTGRSVHNETLERDYGNLGLNTNSESSSQSQVTKSKRGYSSADELDMDYNTSTSTSHRTHEFSSSELRKQYSDGTEPVYAKSSKSFREHDTKSESFGTGSMRPSLRSYEKKRPVALTADEANTDLEIGCTVEVIDNPENSRYGVIRWLGYLGDKNKPLVGLEMEVENKSCTDGKFGEFQLFECPPNKGFFVYLNKLRKDSRFEESPDFADRRNSLAFGSIECHEIAGAVLAPAHVSSLSPFIGKNKGIQGHHNSCYMDATLFSMFAFTTAFDGLLQWERGGTTIKDRVQIALREAIVNPLRKNFFVRADKVMNLRVLLDEHSKVQGLTHAEKDPEEFLNSLLQDTLKAEPFIKLSNGLQANMYQLILDKDEEIILPTTQKLLGLSFLQANLKLTECPKSLILQMPRCGKRFKMYQRIVPSLTLDITDLLDEVPRECTICSGLATYECQDCFKHFGDGSFLDITFCNDCLYKSHSHVKRASHNPTPLQIPQSMADQYNSPGGSLKSSNPPDIPRVTLGLFAVICIETSHYVSFVKAGKEPNSPWLFFDSMADRMGEQHGYNVPQVKVCRELPEWLREGAREKIVACRDNRDLPEHVRRVICDGYICMYQQQDTPTHAQNR